MRRRTLLTSVPVGLSIIAGCLDIGDDTDGSDDGVNEDVAADAPAFAVDEDAPGAFTLLRIQPQEPGGVTDGDEFDIGVVLGNAGGEPVTGEADVELVPPTDDEAVQPATVVIDDELPSGAARFFTTGPFEATVPGDWELTAGSGIDRVHPEYDGTVAVGERPED